VTTGDHRVAMRRPASRVVASQSAIDTPIHHSDAVGDPRLLTTSTTTFRRPVGLGCQHLQTRWRHHRFRPPNAPVVETTTLSPQRRMPQESETPVRWVVTRDSTSPQTRRDTASSWRDGQAVAATAAAPSLSAARASLRSSFLWSFRRPGQAETRRPGGSTQHVDCGGTPQETYVQLRRLESPLAGGNDGPADGGWPRG
jgi:hypothetical protein